MKSAGTGLTDLVLNAYFCFVVNEHYDCQALLTIGHAVVQSSVALRP